MAVFLSTAFRYMKGQSGLPSILPARGSISLAKENSREVRLFCKGLEYVREIFYTDDHDSPGSPGSTSSSSTLVNPRSREVSPTVVKDFAYPDSDSKEIYDPVAIVGKETKKELLKQLQKKTATEEKASQDNEKLKARNKILRAELESMKAIVQDRDVRADLAKVKVKALTLSNVVLRQVLQDLGHELSRKKDGAQIQGPRSQEKTPCNLEKKEVLQGQLRIADEYGVSAYGRIAPSENASAERAHCLDNVQDQEILQREDKSPIGKAVHSKRKEPGSTAVEYLSQNALDKTQSGGTLEINSLDPAALSDTITPPSPSAETDMASTNASGPATLWGILASTQGEDKAKDRAAAGEQTADFSETEAEPFQLSVFNDELALPPTPPNTAVASSQASTSADGEGHAGKDDHEPRHIVAGSSSIAPAEGADESGVVYALSHTPACTPASPPHASSSSQVEKPDVINPVPRQRELSATQKRRAERKRKAVRERAPKEFEEAMLKCMAEDLA